MLSMYRFDTVLKWVNSSEDKKSKHPFVWLFSGIIIDNLTKVMQQEVSSVQDDDDSEMTGLGVEQVEEDLAKFKSKNGFEFQKLLEIGEIPENMRDIHVVSDLSVFPSYSI
jgi:hypothetical protein